MDVVELLEVAAGLRRVLAAVAAGEVDASASERAFLAGAAEALERTTPTSVRDTDV
jgi:hypothetical protein